MLNKKIFLIVALLGGIFIFQNCSKSFNPFDNSSSIERNDLQRTVNASDGQIRPVISGTFIDFWGKGNWTADQWDTYMKDIKDIGISTVIVQFTAYEQYCWFYSPTYADTSENYINALPRLLYAASVKGIDVYVGIYFDDEYWNNTANSSWLNAQAEKNKTMVSEIWNQYGGYMGFKGWYISYEPAPYYYNTDYKANILKDNLINPISDYCKSLSGKSVAIAAYFNQALSSTSDMIYFMKRLSSAHLDIIMLQDGVGVGHVSMDNLGSYYNAAKWGLFSEGDFPGAFWSDSETFDGSLPASIDRVEQQLGIASWYVDKIVSFQHYKDMYAVGPNGSLAAKLRTDYKNYYLNH